MTPFIELTDRSILNVNDIILLNVDKDKKTGGYIYRLYLKGKGMTLRLHEDDYQLIRRKILEMDNAPENEK